MVVKTFNWPSKAVEMLEALLRAGCSASQIAGELSASFDYPVTRNMVIGKTHRVKGSGAFKRQAGENFITDNPAHAGNAARAKKRKLEKQAKPKEEPVMELIEPFVEPEISLPVTERVTIFELHRWQCKWPSGNPGEEAFSFCGKPARVGKPYCAAHYAVAYVKPSDKRLRLPRFA